MKSKIYILIVFVAASFLPGCYTKILWDPENPESTNYMYLETDTYSPVESYYPGGINGGYSVYYSTPWWHIPSVSVNAVGNGHIKNYTTTPKVKTRDVEDVRQPVNNTRDNSSLPPPTRTGTTGSSTPAQGTTNTGNSSTQKRDASSDSRETRSDDGTRSSSKEKK